MCRKLGKKKYCIYADGLFQEINKSRLLERRAANISFGHNMDISIYANRLVGLYNYPNTTPSKVKFIERLYRIMQKH